MPKWISIEVNDSNQPERPSGPAPKRDNEGSTEETKSGGNSTAWIVSIIATLLVLLIAGAAWFLWVRPNQTAAVAATSGPSVPSSPGVPAPLDDLPNVVATVNGDPITREQLTQLIRINQAVYPLTNGGDLPIDATSLQQMRTSLLDQIVNSRLQLRQAKLDGVVAADADVEKDLTAFQSNYGMDQGKLQASLSRYGLTVDDLRNWIRDSSTVNKWVVIKSQEAAKQGKPFTVESWLNDQLVTADIQYNMKGGGGGQPLRVGEVPPDFSLKDLNGKTWTVSELKGKPVVLNFWATWCAPCKFEMPALESVYQKYKDKGLVVLAVDIKTDNGEAAVRKYQQELGMSFPIVMDSTGETENNYRVRAYPTSFFIGKDGKLREVKRGAFMSADQIAASVDKIVN